MHPSKFSLLMAVLQGLFDKHFMPALARAYDRYFMPRVAMFFDVPTVEPTGGINTATSVTTNVDFSSTLTLEHESEVPLLALLTRLTSKKTATFEYKFAVGRFAPRIGLVSADVAQGAVGASIDITVDHGEYFLPTDGIEIPDTYDDATHVSLLRVISIAGNVLTCKAYDPATYGPSKVDAGAEVRIMFSSSMEASSGRPARQTIPTVYSNYIQTFEDYFNVSDLQMENRLYILPERVRLREETRKKHALDMENAVWFSKKVKDVTSGGTYGGSANHPVYMMDGVLAQIRSNVLNYGAALSGDELFDIMSDVHSPMFSGGTKRTMFVSADLQKNIQKLGLPNQRTTRQETTWGVTITTLDFAGKQWQLVETPALTNNRPGWGVVVHPAYFQMRNYIATQYRMNVQGNKDNYVEDGFKTSTSVSVLLEELFAVIKP